MENFSLSKILEKSPEGIIFNFKSLPFYVDNKLYVEERLTKIIEPTINGFNDWQMDNFDMNYLNNLVVQIIKTYQLSIEINPNDNNVNFSILRELINWIDNKVKETDWLKNTFKKYPQLKEYYYERYIQLD